MNSDLVVVGQLKLTSYLLSFDGVHVNGSIAPEEVLYGGVLPGSTLQFHQVVPCSVWDVVAFYRPVHCDYRAVWEGWSGTKNYLSQRWIWALWRGPASS